MTEQLTLLPEDFPAKTYPNMARKQAYKAKEVDFTNICFPLLASTNHNGSYLKTSQHCYLEMEDDGFQGFLMTWPATGMMHNGMIYQLPRSAPSITEIGFGLLPTPLKSCQMVLAKFTIQSQVKSQNAGHQSRLWPFLLKLANYDLRKMNQITENLMGFPLNHTHMEASEIQSIQQSLK